MVAHVVILETRISFAFVQVNLVCLLRWRFKCFIWFLFLLQAGYIGLYCDGGVNPYNAGGSGMTTLSVNGRDLTDLCSQNGCKNGGTCYEISDTEYGCACKGGFYGKLCESSYLPLDVITSVTSLPVFQSVCSNSPCLNGGTCKELGLSDYTCLCTSKQY